MPTENTSLKNTTPAGDSNTTNEIVIMKINTYQRSFLIVAGSLLASLAVIAVTGTSGGQHLQSSAHEITERAVALADYQVVSANLALTKDIFGLDAVDGRPRRPACSHHSACTHLEGDCCPTTSGVRLSCCNGTGPCKCPCSGDSCSRCCWKPGMDCAENMVECGCLWGFDEHGNACSS